MGGGLSKEQQAEWDQMRKKIKDMEAQATAAKAEKTNTQNKIAKIEKDAAEKEEQRAKELADHVKEVERVQNESKRMQEENERIYKENREDEMRKTQDVMEQLREALKMQEEYRKGSQENDLRRVQELEDRIREARMLQEENKRIQEENERIYRESKENELRREREMTEQLREARRVQEENIRIQEDNRRLREEKRRQEEEKKMDELARRIEAEAMRRVQEENYLRVEAERYLNEGIPPVRYPTGAEIQAVKKILEYEEGNLHFAITGVSGSGKSSLVNAFRGLSNSKKDPNAARTGTRETTKNIGRYRDPTRDWINWYDIPGAGTLKVPDWQYFNSQGLFIFDIIIIAIDSRFTKIDVGLLFSCQRFGIPAFVIRSKGDTHIRSILGDESDSEEGNGYEEDDSKFIRGFKRFKAACDQLVNDTREEFESILTEAGLPQQRVYTVSKDTLRNLIRGSKDPGNIIHEVELMNDILYAANERRRQNQCLISQIQIPGIEESQPPVYSN